MAFLKEYLTGRKMKVRVGASTSRSANVTSGVVQGSTLGPTLFLAYINQVAELELSEKSQMILFADDIVLIHSLDEGISEIQIQSDLNQIYQCLMDMALMLNTSKCKYMIFSLAPQGPKKNTHFQLGTETLTQVDQHKYLGVIFDQKLSFDHQTRQVVTKTKRSVGALSRCIRKWASKKVLATAIQTISLPIMLYSIETWYPTDLINQRNLEKLQKYGARLVTNNFNTEAQYEEILIEAQWKPIYRIVAERRLTMIKSYMEGIRYAPDDLFQPNQLTSGIRRSSRLASTANHSLMLSAVLQCNNSKASKLALHRMVELWNSLDETTVRSRPAKFHSLVRSEEIFSLLCERGSVVKMNDI
jgi:hypothetical protein